MHPKKLKGVSLGLGLQFLNIWVLGLGILQISCEFQAR